MKRSLNKISLVLGGAIVESVLGVSENAMVGVHTSVVLLLLIVACVRVPLK